MDSSISTTILFSLAAGFLGTIIMTISQFIEIAITRRASSFTPAIISSRIFRFDFNKLNQRQKVLLNYITHFGFGTFLGIFFPLFAFLISSKFFLFLGYGLFIWIQGLVTVSTLGGVEPFWRWGRKWIFIDAFHHTVLAVFTGFFYFLILQI